MQQLINLHIKMICHLKINKQVYLVKHLANIVCSNEEAECKFACVGVWRKDTTGLENVVSNQRHSIPSVLK